MSDDREAVRERAADAMDVDFSDFELRKDRAASRRKRLWYADHEADEGSRIYSEFDRDEAKR